MNTTQAASAALIYLIVGFMVWVEIALTNYSRSKNDQPPKYTPIRSWKVMLLWVPHLIFGIPNTKWMCK
jgi:hypothetical protein